MVYTTTLFIARHCRGGESQSMLPPQHATTVPYEDWGLLYLVSRVPYASSFVSPFQALKRTFFSHTLPATVTSLSLILRDSCLQMSKCARPGASLLLVSIAPNASSSSQTSPDSTSTSPIPIFWGYITVFSDTIPVQDEVGSTSDRIK